MMEPETYKPSLHPDFQRLKDILNEMMSLVVEVAYSGGQGIDSRFNNRVATVYKLIEEIE